MSERGRGSRRALHLALAVVLAGLTACSPFDDAMVAVFGRSMRDQISLDPYENPRPAPQNSVPFASPNYPAGPGQIMTGQAEPAGAVPPPMTQVDLLQRNPGVMELENPVEPTEESRARGQELYTRYCAVCHGDSGVGSEAYVVDRYPVLPAYNLAGEAVQSYPDGYIYGMIRVGRGLMPPYGYAIPHYDRWHIVNYVRQLQEEYEAAQGGGAGGEG